MKKKEYTQEEKQAYFAGLRAEWKKAKQLAAEGNEASAIYSQLAKMGLRDISLANCQLVFMQAQAAGFPADSLPYVDFKTYQDWRKAGFQVRGGETSKVYSITWVGNEPKEGESDEAAKQRKCWPKVTYLFHISQCDEIIVPEAVAA